MMRVVENALDPQTRKVSEEVVRVERFLPSSCLGEEDVPPAIFCVGLNYRRHAEETGFPLPRYPVIFMKNTSAICTDSDTIRIPRVANSVPEVDYECELAAVISKTAKDVSTEDALDYVLGYTVVNDVSARRWQGKKGGGQWARAKSFDTFAPVCPSIYLASEVGDPNAGEGLSLKTTLNDNVVQNSSTNDMVFSVAELISFLSQGTSLLPGTVIMTGTPEGVGYTRDPPLLLKDGDFVEVRLGELSLSNPVVEEQ